MEGITLANGIRLDIDLLYRPVAIADQLRVTELLAAEWERTDVDWSSSLRGVYAESLMAVTAVGRYGDLDVGTASIAFPVDEPEIAVVENVTTLAEHRRCGIAAALTETLVQFTFDVGCRLCFLGNGRRANEQSVYEQIRFTRVRAGTIMRRAAPEFEDYEEILYLTGQPTLVRSVRWGDLPGVVALAAQPLATCMLDYQRGIGSTAVIASTRCVSAFTSIFYDTQARGGMMRVLAGASASRVLGFGTATPGPAPLRRATSVVDLVTHDDYANDAEKLLAVLTEDGSCLGADRAVAYVAAPDNVKRELFLAAGYREARSLPRELTVGDEPIDVDILEYFYG